MWFYKGGKCGYFVLIKNDILEYNLPYVQSNFTCNPGPMNYFTFEIVLVVIRVWHNAVPTYLPPIDFSARLCKINFNVFCSCRRSVVA